MKKIILLVAAVILVLGVLFGFVFYKFNFTPLSFPKSDIALSHDSWKEQHFEKERVSLEFPLTLVKAERKLADGEDSMLTYAINSDPSAFNFALGYYAFPNSEIQEPEIEGNLTKTVLDIGGKKCNSSEEVNTYLGRDFHSQYISCIQKNEVWLFVLNYKNTNENKEFAQRLLKSIKIK
ncbi:hypothetical protein AAIR98_000380 [Elusimicrobium simillimum]|uniref:hypothetical protein n=1 Tax=Elusimicrobium simillimum TaxID=3143438 RepID=UPI003C6FCA49